tara:strand:+ start:802 stop:1104 length:303 start_codon:yes stop_codon:yes gene_type:complete
MQPRNYAEEEKLRKSQKSLFLYLISQRENGGWDTYDSAVVVARSKEDAVLINPGTETFSDEDLGYHTWASTPDNVIAVKVGEACGPLVEGTVIISSFNAG